MSSETKNERERLERFAWQKSPPNLEGMRSDPNGEWIRYPDIAKLLDEGGLSGEERERLRKIATGLEASLDAPEDVAFLRSLADRSCPNRHPVDEGEGERTFWPDAIFVHDRQYSDWTEVEICDPDTPGARRYDRSNLSPADQTGGDKKNSPGSAATENDRTAGSP